MRDLTNLPFHAGELEAQARTGASDVPEWAASFIRPFMPDQHRDFFGHLPFLVVAGADGDGRHWVTLLDGPDGFVTSPDPETLFVSVEPDPQDPLADMLRAGGDVGVLGIELNTRRRNRMNGRVEPAQSGFAVKVGQSFGNCPQYIHERNWRRVPTETSQPEQVSAGLSQQQIQRIAAADTLFIGTGQSQGDGSVSNGFDASHRGGAPGFVAVQDATRLRIPDYAGNNFFNTIGNLLENPAIGLVFVDFDTGGLLHVSGRAHIDWDAKDSHDPNALRMIDVQIDTVVDRPAALSLRWSAPQTGLRPMVVTHKVKESADVTSFYLAAKDSKPLLPFAAGQHLPIAVDIPGQPTQVERTYSLSGAPEDAHYRITVKREAEGLVSRHLHDEVAVGDTVWARKPSGDFVLPDGTDPVVLVSAGVGMTPMLSMLHAAAQDVDRKTWFIHGARNRASHPLRTEVAALLARHSNLHGQTWYSQPGANDQPSVDFDAHGRITACDLLDLGAGPDAQYMLCGPTRFVADVTRGLEQAGVDSARIHVETFGPSG